MNKLLRGAIAAAGLVASIGLTALPASATTPGSWTISQTHYNVYSDGGYASMYFTKSPSSSVPSGAKITNLTYQVAAYSNGNVSDKVELCYQKQYTATNFLCEKISVTGSTSIPDPTFNGLDPKGTFVITHTLTGGTYPATGSPAQDTVKVDYQY